MSKLYTRVLKTVKRGSDNAQISRWKKQLQRNLKRWRFFCYRYDTINVIKEYLNVVLKTLDHIIIKKVRAVQEDLVRKESEEATKEEKSEEYEYYYEEEEQAADTK